MKDTDIIAAIAPDAVSLMDKAIAEIKRLRQENATLTAERDEARQCTAETDHRTFRLLSEISCRVEHGADSNGHLDAIWNLWKEGRL